MSGCTNIAGIISSEIMEVDRIAESTELNFFMTVGEPCLYLMVADVKQASFRARL